MQTLKTAIVVVLLLTVTYSAYVALTAPPATELPDSIAGLLEGSENGEFDVDLGEPATFDEPLLPPPMDGASPDPLGGLGDPTASGSDLNSTDLPLPPPTDIPTPPSTALPGVNAPDKATMRMSDESTNSIAAPPADLSFDDPATAPLGQPTSADPATPQPQGSAPSPSVPSLNKPAETGIALPPGANSSSATPPSNTSGSAAAGSMSTALVNAIATADRQCSQQQFREALTTLSLFYNSPDLTDEQRAPLLERLDFLAGEVIYSSRHLMEQPYRVRQGETVQSIATLLNVPWQLLATINQISDPAAIAPGTELKVLKGPFRAEVNLKSSELTVFLGELYAGRFSIQSGNDPAPKPGSYTVLAKQSDRTYYPLNGANIPGGDPRNPYGDVWIDLGSQMSIHGSPQQSSGSSIGCIQMRPNDARDVFGILSQGSAVSILR